MAGKKQNQEGFSLIELLIYISIVAVATTVFTAFIVDSVINATKVLAVKEVNQNTRLVVSQISQEIKTAKSIQTVTTSQLNLLNKNGDAVSFYLNSANSRVYYNDGLNILPISSDSVKVTKLEFEQIAPDTVEIVIAVKQGNENARIAGQHELELSAIVTARQPLY